MYKFFNIYPLICKNNLKSIHDIKIDMNIKNIFIYRKYNLIMRFSKYEFYNKYLSGVTLFRVISCVT